MRKSRVIVALAAVVIFAGLGLGVLAYVSVPGARAQIGTLPEAAAWMPASAAFIAYFDLESLLSSPLREEFEAHIQERTLSEIDEFRQKTGMDPWTDFRALALATRPTEEGSEWGLALAGNLNPDAIISAIEDKETLEQSMYQGTTLYTFNEGRDHEKPRVIAFPTLTVALFGSPDYVHDMLDVGSGRLSAGAEGPLAGWINELPLNDTFWCVGSSDVGFARFMARQSVDAPRIPPLQSFAVSGNLGSAVSMVARGKASGPEDAQKLADVVRGFIALGSLQNQTEPEVQAVIDSIQIGVVENKVEVAVEVPYETLRRLYRSSVVRRQPARRSLGEGGSSAVISQ